MSMTLADRRRRCLTAICDDSRLLLVGRKRRERMARFAVDCACELRASGLRDERDIRDVLRARMKTEFGSIWVMIAFTIIWELVKQWLFD